jgi:hypothetical protein
MSRVLLVILGLMLLTACVTSQPDQQPGSGEQHGQQALTAERVVAGLTKAIPTAKLSVVFTAESDPNHMLGRPNGYLSKAAFTDSRVDLTHPSVYVDTTKGAVDLGGSVEVFLSEQGAQARAKYIKDLSAAKPVLTAYEYVAGPVLLRLGKSLTPAQAAEYQKALAVISGR